MGSQTLDIFRQGVWASLTGGWFYDPHQNVFCNAVHLYIWLFLVCAPFVTYLYFPKTFTTWSAYCFVTAFTITVLKVINMTLHVLYDRSHTFISDTNLKNQSKTSKEGRGEDECGIEMQVLGLESTMQPGDRQLYKASVTNSALSMDCQDQNTSTIDLKVDVHRKNSSESNDSTRISNDEAKNDHTKTYIKEFDLMKSNYGINAQNVKSTSEPIGNNILSENSNGDKDDVSFSSVNDHRKKMKTKFNWQPSLDITDIDTVLNSHSHIEDDEDGPKIRNVKLPKLQRHRSSESTDNNHRRNINSFHNDLENQIGGLNRNRNNLQDIVPNMYLETNYTKSDLGIENIEYDSKKLYTMKQSKSMRKDSMSALQLPVGTLNCNNSRKRRHSNTGNKILNTPLSSVRRIKSAALEIGCPQPSVSNLSPHPNSTETISGQQIKNPESGILPPPSKCLVRNPHLTLCPKVESFGATCSGIIDPVYPIVEQADEKCFNDGFSFIQRTYVENDTNEGNVKHIIILKQKRCSVTESESDLDHPRTQSTDSETDNNGSSSPLLNKVLRTCDKEKLSNNLQHKALSLSMNKSGESGCASSDCEQASATSKDMLLTKSTNENNWLNYSSKLNVVNDCYQDSDDLKNDSTILPSTRIKEQKSLGAIPKVSMRSEELFTPAEDRKRTIQISPSDVSSSGSSRSYSCESFSNDIYRSYKEQWLMVGTSKQSHNLQNILPINCDHADSTLNAYQRKAILDGNFKLQPILTRSTIIKQRNNEMEDKLSRDEGDMATAFEFGNGEIRNSRNATLSIQDFMHEQYSFRNSISCEQRPSAGAILNLGRVEFNDSVYCDYWRPCSLSTEKHIQPKRFYNYRLKFFGRREFRIAMDRLQLLALFDRDLNWIHVIFAILLSSIVCLLGSIVLHMGIYKDMFAFIFCIVMAGSQYSLLKSVQPDAASPIHGFNKTVAYSRPIYFCLCSSILLLSCHLSKDIKADEIAKYQKTINIFGVPLILQNLLDIFTNTLTIILLLFPVLFSLGLFPQINTFCMYILEQIDMHIFGGSAVCSLEASILCIFKSLLAVSILYGPIYGGLMEQKGTQHILFSIFCALLVPIAYHLSRSASDFSHVWVLIKSNMASYSDEEEETFNKSKTDVDKLESGEDIENKDNVAENDEINVKANEIKNTNDNNIITSENELPDPLPKKLQNTVNCRLKNDLVVSTALAVFILALHSSTVFTVLQPDLNSVLYSIAGVLGFCLHYLIPQMRKHLPWLCFAKPLLKQQEYGRFEVAESSKLMWFEKLYVYLCFLERNVLYPLIFISALTADSQIIVKKFGISLGTTIIAVCGLKGVRSAYSDSRNQYLILIFSVLLFKFDFKFASETFLLDYFFISFLFRKCCEFLLKMQFIVTYIAPWQITWGSAFHAFAQPFSVPHSAMLFIQAAVSSILSTPLNPFLGSAIFLTSYVRPIKFWERDYNTKRIDHSNTRLSSQLERDLGADDNNLNSIFYEHLTRSLQHSLCGDLMLGRWGNVNQGDCFVLASDYLNCLVHIIELGNGLCTFQMRGLEFRGTYCQQREVEAISEGIEDNDGCCCCAPGHIPRMLSANAMFSTRWLAWQVVAAQYVLEGYSISENLATATLQLFEFRKVLITYYIKSIIYYVTQNAKLNDWLAPGPIREALDMTLNRQFVDLDPIFNYNLDEDFDFRALGITRGSFCYVYLNWIQFCYAKRNDISLDKNMKDKDNNCDKNNAASGANSMDRKESLNELNKEETSKSDCVDSGKTSKSNIITKDSQLVSLCLALGLLARRSLATASHSSLSGVDFFLHGLHALFKGDFRITSPRDEWVFADMELLHGVVAPAVKMGLKLHQDHFSSPDEYLDPAVLYEAISSHSKDLVISHEADPIWRNAVLRGAPNLLALRHVMEDGSDEYRIIRLTKRFLSFRVIKLNRECVRGLWAGQQQELIYLRNRNPERGSIQNAKQALRNIINSSCDQPIGYPIYVSPLTTSYAETNEQLSRIIGGSITLEAIQNIILDCWRRLKERCREGCSSGSGGIDCDTTNELPGTYYSPTTLNNSAATTATFSYGSQSLPGSSMRTTLASMTKPTSSTLFVGFLNRERDQDRESIRDRFNKKNLQLRVERDRRATLPIATSALPTESTDLMLKDMTSITSTDLKGLPYPETCTSKVMSNSADNLTERDSKTSFELSQDNIHRSQLNLTDGKSNTDVLVELNKKVIIVDGMEIYDCLDLGRRIDVIWPNEKMRCNGGRSSWKEWAPKEGMVGFVVHYWQPNHPDQRFRSNVNRTLYLVEIGDRFVPVGEQGIREYKQIGFDFSVKNLVVTKRNIKLDSEPPINIPTSTNNFINELQLADCEKEENVIS